MLDRTSAMPPLDIPSSPSDDGSLVFDSSSEGVHTPNERVSPVISGAKGVTAVGVAVHSPPALFVGTPFTTGANTLFEYPFPPTRPALSATSSISSVASSILGPPSPSTRAKYIPRTTKSQSTSRRRLSGNSPLAVRIPPRLRTDSSGSVASTSESGTSKPLSRQVSLRDRSGSLGVLPIQLPPPSIATMGLGPPVAGPLSPAALVGAMASTGVGMAYTTEPDEEQGVANGKRRASMPALFTPEFGRGEEGRLDGGDIDDHPQS